MMTPTVGPSGQLSPDASLLPSPSTGKLTAPELGLDAYYAFEGNANSHDLKHNGLVREDSSFKEGLKQQAIYFPYASDGAIGVSFIKNYLPIQLGKSFTISVWVKPAPDPHRRSRVSMPILCASDSELLGRFGLFWTPGGTDVFINQTKPNELWLHREKTPRSDLPDNVWYHITASYDGQQLNLYQNGKLELTRPYASGVLEHGMLTEIGQCSAVTKDPDSFRFSS